MKTPRLMACARALSLGLAIGGAALMVVPPGTGIVMAQSEATAEAREAIAAWNARRYEEAVRKFETLVAQRLDNDQAKAVRAEVTRELALTFANNSLADVSMRSRLSGVGKWLLAGRTSDADGKTLSASGKIANDAEGVKRYVKEYFSETNLLARGERARAIANQYGEYAVPEIVANYLTSQSADHRGRSRNLLAAIGAESVLPLIQALRSSDDDTRKFAAFALGDIGDARSLPALQTLADDSNQAEGIREAASGSIARITKGQGTGSTAHDLWLAQALGYYRNLAVGGYSPGTNPLIGSNIPGNLPLLVDDADRTRTVWRWRDGALVREEIPLWNYSDTLAEDCVMQALALGVAAGGSFTDSFLMRAGSLFARIATHQALTNRARLGSLAEGEKEAVIRQLGENGVSRLSHLLGLAGAAGSRVVLLAIEDSRADGYADVTAGLCDLFLELDQVEPIDVSALGGWSTPTEGDAAPVENRDSGGGLSAQDEPPVAPEPPVEPEMPSGDAPTTDAPPAEEVPVVDSPTEIPAVVVEEPVLDLSADPLAPLTRCLTSPSRAVRYAAARAIVVVGRGRDLPGTASAFEQFSASLEETDIKTVLVIAATPQVRQAYHNSLLNLGYAVRAYSDLSEGLHQARNSATIDAIVMEGELARKVVSYWEPSRDSSRAGVSDRREENAVKLLRDDVRTKNVPLLLVAPEGTESELSSTFSPLFGDTFTENGILGYGENAGFSESALGEKLEGAITPNEDSRQASTNAQVEKSAKALLLVNGNSGVGNFDLVMKRLTASVRAANGRTSAAKAASARAIAHLADSKAVTAETGADTVAALAELLNGTSSVDTPAVRAETAKALGRLFRASPTLYRERGAAFTGLMATVRLQPEAGSDLHSVVAARNAAGVALGLAPLSAGEKLEVLAAANAGSIPVTAAAETTD